MINKTKAKMVTTLINDYLTKGWTINFGPNQASLGDGSRIYITDEINTICFKVYDRINSDTNTVSTTLDIISFPEVGFIDDLLWDKNGNLEARIDLD